MAGQFGWFLNMITFGMCSGAAVFISQYWGAKDTAGIRRTYGIAVVSVCLISALFFVIGLLFPEGVVRIFNREPDVVEAGAAYLRIACWSYLATGVNMVFCIVLRSTENVKLPMYVSLVTTVLNAFMDYGLIFGAFGMPEMGIRGAALATVISAWAGPVLILAVSAIQRNMLITPMKELFGFNRRSIAEYYEKATPVIINETLWGLGTLLFSVIFANLGYQYYAAVTIFRTFDNIAFVFFIGLCNASSIMVGKNVGAGHIKRAVEDSRRFVLFVSLCSVLTGVLIIIFRFQLASVFNLSGSITLGDAQAHSLAAPCLRHRAAHAQPAIHTYRRHLPPRRRHPDRHEAGSAVPLAMLRPPHHSRGLCFQAALYRGIRHNVHSGGLP